MRSQNPYKHSRLTQPRQPCRGVRYQSRFPFGLENSIRSFTPNELNCRNMEHGLEFFQRRAYGKLTRFDLNQERSKTLNHEPIVL